MPDPFIGQIMMFGGNFPPRGWAMCDGQLLQIAQNSALFSILGTIYGGDGRTTFGLPDLRGRGPLHQGTGPGLTPRPIGQESGTEDVTLSTTQIPAHNHNVNVTKNPTSQDPSTRVLAESQSSITCPNPIYGDRADGDIETLAPDAVTDTGGDQSHANMQPFLVITFIIALEGVFPQR